MRSIVAGALLGAAMLAVASGAQASTLFAANAAFGGLINGVMGFNGADLTSTGGSFLTSGHIAGLATDGAHVYASLPGGISEFTLDGVLEHTYVNGAFDNFGALAVKDGTLYAANSAFGGLINGVMAFNASDLTSTGDSFLTNGHIAGLATDGTSVYAALPGGIFSFTTEGVALSTYLNGAFDSFGALALDGGLLYAANAAFGGLINGVMSFNAADLTSTGDSFLTNGHIAGLAADGTSIFASLPGGISSFTLTGEPARSYLNGAFDSFGALAVTPPAVIVPPPPAGVPEPQSWVLMIAGLGAIGLVLRRRPWPAAHAIARPKMVS